MNVLKEHDIYKEFIQGESPTITIEVENNLPVKSIETSCGCTSVHPAFDKYKIKLSPLQLVKFILRPSMYENLEDKHYMKSVDFTLHREDGEKEKVTITIKVKENE